MENIIELAKSKEQTIGDPENLLADDGLVVHLTRVVVQAEAHDRCDRNAAVPADMIATALKAAHFPRPPVDHGPQRKPVVDAVSGINGFDLDVHVHPTPGAFNVPVISVRSRIRKEIHIAPRVLPENFDPVIPPLPDVHPEKLQ